MDFAVDHGLRSMRAESGGGIPALRRTAAAWMLSTKQQEHKGVRQSRSITLTLRCIPQQPQAEVMGCV